ncbi:hypothetical protein TSARBOMBA_175 [Bacillus phage TsarBomba]|uniref:Uncharacterized protein n=1 Tax=Bacillus phage TsarBomba TaxID=1690456 RepID=A0A0K2D0G1_9CAUD|nr:hypothetical protein TSARBOMBA_175 [Bacillus phage TsarBomba]ALA13208.1 hypothetical protein TSARBOMBA_175 [Bacillus phage TsarBomba]
MKHKDRLYIMAQNLDRAVNDWVVEHGSQKLYDWVVEHGGDPETLEVISYEENIQENDSVSIQRFKVKRMEEK